MSDEKKGPQPLKIHITSFKDKLTSEELIARLGAEPETQKEPKGDKPFDVGGLQAAKE